MFETDDKINEPNTILDEKIETYYTDTFSPGEIKQQLRVGSEVVSDYVNPIFGNGEDGDLYIKSGETKTIPSGIYNYNNFTIESGGTLAPSDGNNPFIIKVKGATKILGTIAFNGIDGSYRAGGEISNQFGEVLTKGTTGQGGNGGGDLFSSGGTAFEGLGGGGGGGWGDTLDVVAKGGTGGTGYVGANSGGIGQTESNRTSFTTTSQGQLGGNSRGGAGGFRSDNATFVNATAGSGGDGRGGGITAQGTGQNGTNASIIDNNGVGTIALGGGGGGGGGRGYNGADLILIANNLSGNGTINTSGTNGYNGGNGGAGALAFGYWIGHAYSGKGGGGGGGGASGVITIIYEGENNITTINNVGTGGTGGTGYVGGNNGSSGTQGVKIIKKLSEIY